MKRCAYDWRAEHVSQFEEEIVQYERRGIEFFAFWGTHEDAFGLFEKHGLHPQIVSPGSRALGLAQLVTSTSGKCFLLACRHFAA